MTMLIEWPTSSVYIASYFNFIIPIISFFATLLAIIAYFTSLTIRQAYQNLLLLNLLINAMVYSITQIIFFGNLIVMKNSNIFSIEWVCSLNGFLNVFCCCMEIYTLMCIALERYFAIKKQQPLTLHQIIGLLVFGWIEVGVLSSIPLWSHLHYDLSDAKMYCIYPFFEHKQLHVSITGAAHVFICISVICYFYTEIYKFYSGTRRKRNSTINKKESMLQSHVMNEDSNKKNEDNEFRVFLTTLLLIGWTLIGWTPMLLMITYQIISGQPVSPYWDIVSSVVVTTAVCGDSIILLVYDRRWKTSLREMISNMGRILP